MKELPTLHVTCSFRLDVLLNLSVFSFDDENSMDVELIVSVNELTCLLGLHKHKQEVNTRNKTH